MRIFNELLDLIFPPHCVVCGAGGAWFCSACQSAVVPLPEPGCSHCGRPLTRPGTCHRCQLEASHLLSITSCSAHRQPLRQVIHAYKYRGMRVLCEPLADLLQVAMRAHQITGDVIVPVPLHRARMRERGYNQSALLAGALGKRINVPVIDDALMRVKNTPAQVGLSREQRRQNMSGAFRCGQVIPAWDIVLVDDVCTTGATLEACAEELLRVGAGSVHALTLARALCRYQAEPNRRMV
ncbi:MAG: ComF family protein [Chloroflexi bacterium]|nr:ComF family protein [Chloroflexota bacterium]